MVLQCNKLLSEWWFKLNEQITLNLHVFGLIAIVMFGQAGVCLFGQSVGRKFQMFS